MLRVPGMGLTQDEEAGRAKKADRFKGGLESINGALTQADVLGIFDDEPMCMLMTVSVSSHAARNGSQ